MKYTKTIDLISVAFFSLVGTATSSFAGDPSHGASDSGSSGGLPQFDPTWFPSQIFWLFVCFVLLYVIFARKTLPNISSTIDRRRQQIESDVETTEELTKEAETIYQEYEKNLKEAQSSARALVTTMEKDLKAQADSDQKAFRDKAEETISKTELAIQNATDSAMKDIQAIASEVATETVHKLLGQKVDSKKIHSVVQSLVSPTEDKKSKKAA